MRLQRAVDHQRHRHRRAGSRRFPRPARRGFPASVTSVPKRVRRNASMMRAATRCRGRRRPGRPPVPQRRVVQLALGEHAPMLRSASGCCATGLPSAARRSRAPSGAAPPAIRRRWPPSRGRAAGSPGDGGVSAPAQMLAVAAVRVSASTAAMRPTWAAKKRAALARPRLAQPGGPLAATAPRHRRACARPACRGAAVGKHVQERDVRHRPPAPAFRRTCASVSVGKPAIRSAPKAMPGRSARARAIAASASARVWRRFMRLRIMSSPACSGEMQMRHQPRLLGEQAPQVVVDRGRIDGGQPQARQFRHQREQPAHQLAQRRAAREVGAVAGDVDAGQHDFATAACDQRAHLSTIAPSGTRAGVAAAEGDDAEGAAMVAALLHLHEGAGAAVEFGRPAAARSRAPP